MIPEPDIIYLEFGLFNEIEFKEENKNEIFDILFFDGTIDAYCPKCQKDSVLESIENYPRVNYNSSGDYYENNNIAARSASHLEFDYYEKQRFVLKRFRCSLKKFGQCFSIADYQNHSIKKYRKVLGKEMYNEFSKGVGLFSHGVGIGSFVYLRRIIEKFVIDETFQKESEKPEFDVEVYEKSRVKEKIELLKNSLPDFLVENKALYGILSKGIHELSEQECLDIFPVMKTSIEYILDEVKAKKELDEKKKKLSEQINKINEQLGNK